MFIVLLLVPVSLVLFFAGWHFKQKWHFRSLKHIPSAPIYPLIGSALEFGLNPVEKLKDLTRMATNYGPLMQLRVGPQNHYLIVTDPDLAEFILSSPKFITKSNDYDLLRPWIGNGLLTSTGSYWQKRRKVITPTFHFKILEQFLPIFNAGSNILIKNLYAQADQDVFDIYPIITAYTLDIICETAMGTSVNAQAKDNEYVRAVKTVSSIFINRTFSAWKQFDILFPFASEYKDHVNSLKIIHGFTNSVIQKRRQELLENGPKQTDKKEDNDDDVGMKKKQVFLDLLLQSTVDGKPLTDEDIREEVDTFMFEKKLLEEIDEVFGNDKTREPTSQELNSMKYLEATIKETLRLYPSVPYFARRLDTDVTYEGTNYPKGLIILLYIFYMQRRTDLFKDAKSFNPDRYLLMEKSEGKSSNPFAYVPFSAGPRNCIGQKFAMTEIKSVLTKIFRHFELPPVDSSYDVLLSGEAILKSATGVPVRLKKRI